jgi:hypothetical protein
MIEDSVINKKIFLCLKNVYLRIPKQTTKFLDFDVSIEIQIALCEANLIVMLDDNTQTYLVLSKILEYQSTKRFVFE